MDASQLTRQTIIWTSFALIAGTAVMQAHAASKTPKPPAATTTATPKNGLSMTASGAAEDNLKYCLQRIPQKASTGQRMMAEQGCRRDQESRKAIDAVPGR
jgi:hypothetical protein